MIEHRSDRPIVFHFARDRNESGRLLHPGTARRGTVARKGGKRHDAPANHKLDEYLEAYIKGLDLEADPKRPSVPHSGSGNPMPFAVRSFV